MLLSILSCKPNENSNESVSADDASDRGKVGVLLVNHGSRSSNWRNELLQLEKNVRPLIMADKNVGVLATAFMEYTEPSIATRLKEFDAAGMTDVILVPIFLTVSEHSFDDIPTIIGQKDNSHSRESMRTEKIERYTPKAKVHIAPLLDFHDTLKKNILRRVKIMSKSAKDEGLTLIAYGDQTYEKEWSALMKEVADYVQKETGIDSYSYGWCGHLVKYDPKKTTDVIEEVLKNKKRSLVLPVLVAEDEMFQVRIIGGGVKMVKDYENRVAYRFDAILPDEGVEKWVVDITKEQLAKIAKEAKN